MGNGFNDAEKLSNNGWKGSAVAILEQASGQTDTQKREIENKKYRNDVGVPTALAIQMFKEPAFKSKRKKLKILEEEEYVSAIEKIIRRDFFPELPKLEAQHAYLSALENDDAAALRDISIRYDTPLRKGTATPSAFETPLSNHNSSTPQPHRTPQPFHTPSSEGNATPNTGFPTSSTMDRNDEEEEGSDVNHNLQPKTKKPLNTNLSLDQFLAKYTSEDNDSFEELQEIAADRLKKKHAWLYHKVEAQEKLLSLEPDDIRKKLKESEHGMLMPIEGWRYTVRNSLMYPPEKKDTTPMMAIESATNKTKVSYNRTRFTSDPFRNSVGTTGTSESGAVDAKHAAASPSDSPKVNGYGFVVTPSPAPGVDLDPTMTWGFIDGTPFRLDAGDTPKVSSGPMFEMPEGDDRDQMSRKMCDKSAQKKRKSNAEKRSRAARTPGSTPRAATPASRLAMMSPSAQRLGKLLIGGSGGLLRAAYNGTPTSSPRQTPLHTPLRTPRSSSRSSTPRLTPRSTPRSSSTSTTPRSSSSSAKKKTGSSSSSSSSSSKRARHDESSSLSHSGLQGQGSSLTDDLLN